MRNNRYIKITCLFLIVVFLTMTIVKDCAYPAQADTASDLQDKIDSYAKKLKDAQAQLVSEQSQLYKNKTQISATQTLIKKLQGDMAQKESDLNNLGKRAELNKSMLVEYMRQLYYADQEQDHLSQLVSYEGSLGDMMLNFDDMLGIKSKILDSLQVIQDAKTKAEIDKENLSDKKDDTQQNLKTQQAQQAEIVDNIQDTQATVQELNAKIDKMRGELSDLLGANVSAKDIVDAASIASKATGVRKDFILGELVVETDLGRFTGGCTYKNTRMRSVEKTAFKQIMDELDYDVNKKKISCSPGYGYGGAMGVAQFMPTTWLAYKSKISSMTGHNPPDPWDITDGVVGMAIKLAKGGATSKSGEKQASKIYYCGGSSSPYWKTKCEDYAKKVQYWADNYEDKI